MLLGSGAYADAYGVTLRRVHSKLELPTRSQFHNNRLHLVEDSTNISNNVIKTSVVPFDSL